MDGPIVDRGKNITVLQGSLLRTMDGADATDVVSKAKDLMARLPDPQATTANTQGLLLGLVQSGKTDALTTAIAMAADNKYTSFIVLTSDNLWLYDQTIRRLKTALPGLQVEGKFDWVLQEPLLLSSLTSKDSGLVLVATKNAKVLSKLSELLDRLQAKCDARLPATLIVDDEADQASLDTQMSRRARDPDLDPGRINDLITRLRQRFPVSTYLQVTATPQALFLQDANTLYRPEFTILIEPRKGYVGGSTFFALIGGQGSGLIRNIQQQELTALLSGNTQYSSKNIQQVPASLRSAVCTFYVGATIKYLQNRDTKSAPDLVYSFLCHISQKKADHDNVYNAVSAFYLYLREGLSGSAPAEVGTAVEQALRDAYGDLQATLTDVSGAIPSFATVLDELRNWIVSTDIQIINSDKPQDQPQYDSRYNILIGGTKLSRGVTIKNLLVTYYGRRAQRTNMDTMLQHARMYGYRQADLDVIRLFVTREVEERFRLINESEQGLREVIKQYSGEEYRGIYIGRSLNATRPNVLNPNNTGFYAAGVSHFPRLPESRRGEVEQRTQQLDLLLDQLHPQSDGDAVEITVDQAIEIIDLTRSRPGGGLWDDKRIVTALETLKGDPQFGNRAYLSK